MIDLVGVPLIISVTADGGKLAIQATGQPKADLELVSGENYAMKGTPIKVTFQKDAAGQGDGDDDPPGAGCGCSGGEDQLVVGGPS